MKEKIWLSNIKYLKLSLKTSWTFVFCIDTHVFTVSNIISIKKKEIYLSNKECINDHGQERVNMVAKCVAHMDITNNFLCASFFA